MKVRVFGEADPAMGLVTVTAERRSWLRREVVDQRVISFDDTDVDTITAMAQAMFEVKEEFFDRYVRGQGRAHDHVR